MKRPVPRKSLGQHWLTDRNICDRIARLACPREGTAVLEIGPGAGAITGLLLDRGARLHALEMDEGAIAYLSEVYGDQVQARQLSLSQGDGRTAVLPEPGATKWSVVSNLPYNVGTIIFLNCLEQRVKIDRMVLMFQAEVAQRILAGPGSKNHGFLSVLTALEWVRRRAIKVSPGSFFPQPRIKSEVIVLERDDSLPGWPEPRALFRTFVDGCFKARRKMLKNSLVQAGYGPEGIRLAMEHTGIASTMRGEQLEAKLIAQLFETMRINGDHIPQKSPGR